jgi:NAD(P)H-hydrate epimerase
MTIALLVTAEEMRRLESDAVERGATWESLMEVAGSRIAQAMVPRLEAPANPRVLVLSGPGNNGGDGLVVARHLADRGWQVRCLTWHRPAEGDDRLLAPLQSRGVQVRPLEPPFTKDWLINDIAWCGVIVDALLGTGLKRNIEGELAEIVAEVNDSGKYVVAVDIPSGVDSDTGAILGVAIAAGLTVTVGQIKLGQYLYPGKALRGELILEDIGLDETLSREIATGTLLTEELVRGLLPDRPEDSNKGTFGKAFIVAGSINFIGAAALATQGAMRSGAGLVTLGCAGDLLLILASKLTECTFLPLPSDLGAIADHAAEKLLPELEGYKSLLVGSGLGKDRATTAFLRSLFAKPDSAAHATHVSSRAIGFAAIRTSEEDHADQATKLPPLVLDGDALTILSEWPEWTAAVPEGSVLTPHPGEMARLLGSTVEDVQKDRVAVASDSASKWQQIVVLKGAATVVASPNGKVFVSPFGNPALATAGTGDVLAGAITGLIAQGLEPVDAACAGVYLHGLAGEMLREEFGVAGGLSGDLPVLLAKAQRKVRGG